VDPHFLEGRALPAGLAAFANLLNTAFVLHNFFKQERARGVEVYAELGQGLFGLVEAWDGIRQAHRAFRGVGPTPQGVMPLDYAAIRRAQWVRAGVRLAGHAGALLGSALDLSSGAQILVGEDETLQTALRRGDQLQGAIIQVKGFFQVTSGAFGVLAVGAELAGLMVAP